MGDLEKHWVLFIFFFVRYYFGYYDACPTVSLPPLKLTPTSEPIGLPKELGLVAKNSNSLLLGLF